MHYLLMPLGSAGDVHPFVGLALELQRRGHEVTLATNGYFAKLAERFQLNFVEIGSEAMFREGINNPMLWHPFRSFGYLYHQMIEPNIRPQYDVVQAESQKRKTMVLSNCLGFGALNAKDKLGVPLITVHLQPVMLWSNSKPPKFPGAIGPNWLRQLAYRTAQRLVIDPIVCPSLNRIRNELDLPPISQAMQWWHSKTQLLCLFPEWFCPSQKDWPGPHYQVDFPLWDERQSSPNALSQGIDDKLESFLNAGSPPIAFTPGSANIFGSSFFDVALQACRRIDRRAIFLTRFPEQIPHPLPASIVHVPFVPLSLLLPRCAALVHHGGIGSAAQAMAAGTPQLIRPQAHDQFDNAQRIVEHGLGLSIAPRRFNPSNVAKQLAKILDSPQIMSQCKMIAAKIDPARGCRQAIDFVETLAKKF